MKKKLDDSQKKKGMSFEPEVIGSGDEGEHIILDSNPYVMLNSISQGTIYYCPRDNKYYLSESEEPCPEELFKEKFLPYLRWDYDVFETATLKDGSTKKVSIFPPSPENIAKKRADLIQEAVDNAETPDMEAIIEATTPKELRLNDTYEKLIDQASPDERMARRINRSM